MTPPPQLTELEEDEEKDLKKWGRWMDGWLDGWGTLNGVISRAPVELISTIKPFYLIGLLSHR